MKVRYIEYSNSLKVVFNVPCMKELICESQCSICSAQDSFSPVIETMSQKVSWMTGLNTNTWNDEAELLQVTFTNI
jgi:hypothetical protein